MISGLIVIHALTWFAGFYGVCQAGRMLGMSYSNRLFTKREWLYWAPWALAIGSGGLMIWMSLLLVGEH